ncbi:MAG: hypothetical protein V4651_06895 [Bacteroidota bacterium]
MEKIDIETKHIQQTILSSQYLFLSELKNAERFVAQNELDSALHIAASLSTYAYLNFTSFYTSYRLEKLVQTIGSKVMLPDTQQKKASSGKRKILHVASELYELGGHTPLLLKWIQRDQDSEHNIFLTRQTEDTIPSTIFAQHTIDQSVICHINKGESLVETAQQLLNSASHYDFLVLHIHPNDIVPLLAFANTKPVPIYFLNHADHCFWLGASIIDGLIQLRESSIELDKKRRGMDVPQFVLTIPVNAPETSSGINKQEMLNKYGVDSLEPFVMLTTSTESKFKPLLGYNYFESVIPVLDQNPRAILIIVGISNDKGLAIQYKHPQIKYVGYLLPEELAAIENCVDLYLETFPNSSFTALLQLLMKGKPVHFMFSPPAIFKLFSNSDYYPTDQQKWQQQLNAKIQNPEALATYTRQLVENVMGEYCIEAWHAALKKFYVYADSHAITNPLRYKSDVASSDDISDLILFGISLKERYQYFFFDNRGRKIRLKRILSFYSIYRKVRPVWKQLFGFELQEVKQRIKRLFQ